MLVKVEDDYLQIKKCDKHNMGTKWNCEMTYKVTEYLMINNNGDMMTWKLKYSTNYLYCS